MRALDNTCTLPCVARKLSSAAKWLVWKARPNSVPAAAPAGSSEAVVGSSVAPGVEASIGLDSVDAAAPPGDNELPAAAGPAVRWLFAPFLNTAQFTPDWNDSFNCTSTILASRITCRSMDICDALR